MRRMWNHSSRFIAGGPQLWLSRGTTAIDHMRGTLLRLIGGYHSSHSCEVLTAPGMQEGTIALTHRRGHSFSKQEGTITLSYGIGPQLQAHMKGITIPGSWETTTALGSWEGIRVSSSQRGPQFQAHRRGHNFNCAGPTIFLSPSLCSHGHTYV